MEVDRAVPQHRRCLDRRGFERRLPVVILGFPALACQGVYGAFEEGDVAEVSFDDCTVRIRRTGTLLKAKGLPDSLKRIMQAGGLFPLIESEGYLAPKA